MENCDWGCERSNICFGGRHDNWKFNRYHQGAHATGGGLMKVRISYTVEVNDRFRRAIQHRYGEEGLATRKEIKRWFEVFGDTETENALWDLEQFEKEAHRKNYPIRRKKDN